MALDDTDDPAARIEASRRRALHFARSRKPITPEHVPPRPTFGQRLADRIAAIGGSWAFILSFLAFLAVWAVVNVLVPGAAFDPYPFIFLNLVLSMLAAIQAPVIMMSQNRAAAFDRRAAKFDYEVNLKAELEIMELHDKLDAIRDQNLAAGVEALREVVARLERIEACLPPPRPAQSAREA